VIDVLTVAVLAGITAPAAPCNAPLPRAQAVPAPIVFKTSCGGFRLETDGRVNRLPPRWFAAHSSGTGRRHGADLQIVRNPAGRITLLRRGRLVWRSTGLYPNTGGDVAFGPDAFAFGAYDRGVFLTDLKSPERLVLPGRALYPQSFFRSGRLIVSEDRTITVLSPQGQLERRYAYRRRGGHSFDGDGNRLFFITPLGRLATVSESRLRVGRRLGVDGFISFTQPGRLLIYGARSLTLADLDGRAIAQARWPRARLDILDSGAIVSPDGRHVAFRLSDARAGARKGNAVLFLLSAGDTRAQPIYRHRLGPIGCATGANMRWHGRYLLYGSADGQLAIISAATGRRSDLTRLAQALPPRARDEQPQVTWASDYAQP